MRKVLKFLLYTILSLVAVVVLYLATAFILSRITVDKVPGDEDVAVYIVTNGVHTDIVVPVKNAQKDWTEDFKYSNTASRDSTMQYVALGWGDKGFYLETPTWADLKVSTALKAGTATGSTAIHATFYSSIQENKSARRMFMSNAQYADLVKYIENSLKKDENGRAILIKTKANYGQADAFYEANGAYSIFKTCNSWTNNALKESGQKCCLWTAFDRPIFLKYD